jgi:hypothetical protein
MTTTRVTLTVWIRISLARELSTSTPFEFRGFAAAYFRVNSLIAKGFLKLSRSGFLLLATAVWPNETDRESNEWSKR